MCEYGPGGEAAAGEEHRDRSNTFNRTYFKYVLEIMNKSRVKIDKVSEVCLAKSSKSAVVYGSGLNYNAVTPCLDSSQTAATHLARQEEE